ncbi:hypothetical protein KCP91_08075 [Microvirga sp. SRT01]|uniref:Uncharacterized protein n=1 Tax=Sphingomonas longa TaxID=2778730 RepID=A0ABS2D5Y4_9SPHN|nr:MULTISPECIES: hypothetical protein [Alphaproteobacteria]MBM6576327.1 hypothetical protein [Sphingomonas sp. BT552]MBR7709373.1 hypothetical protein [Microvirga sp. SRT01]
MDDDDAGPPRWSDPVEPGYKAAGWTCLFILLVPFVAVIWFVAGWMIRAG